MLEFLKGLFKDGGAMTFDELASAVEQYNGTAKKGEEINAVNLAQGGYVSKQKFDDKDAELKGVQTQLGEANEEIESYKDMDIEGIQRASEEWKTKYETDTANFQKQLADKDYGYAVDKFFGNYKFASEYAKNGILDEFKKKEFKLDNDTFLGADDYMKSIQEKDPSAFVSENTETLPKWAKSTTQNQQRTETNGFNFNFNGVRAKPKED